MNVLSKILPLFLLFGTIPSFAQTTIVVNTTSPAGPGSIVEALFTANTNSSSVNPHEIIFSGLSKGDIISLSDGSLPVTGDFITVNGDIDGDFRPDITIRSQFGGMSGIRVTGSNNTISYLNLAEFDGTPNAAIQLVDAVNNRVIGNYIGTDLTGTGPADNRNFRSISIEGGSDHVIGDGTPEGLNIISNGSWGIYIINSDNNKIMGNYIGVDITGQVDLGHLGQGIEIFNGSGNTIGGGALMNVISGNNQNGIEINGGIGNRIIGNYIGMDNTGSSVIPNGRVGILLDNATSGNTIQDNLISGNNSQGINLANSSNDLIYGNLIGTDVTGRVNIGNNNFGIWIGVNSTNITIGDGTLARRNIISGNTTGIQISGGTNSVLNNYIGTDIDGSFAIPNSVGGIVISGGTNNQIGAGGSSGNLISGNSYGIGVNVPDQVIYGNYIGTDATGSLPIPNSNQGIRLTGNARNVKIGDGGAFNANYISGNTQEGIIIDGINVNSNTIDLNYIGVGTDGAPGMGNGTSGILIQGDANTNYILNSIIADNLGDGIEVDGIFASNTAFNIFSSNSYYNNGGKAISIVNGAQNDILPPTIIDNQIDGKVTGTSDAGALVEVYLDSEDEGEFYAGNTFADASGNWSFSFDLLSIPPGLFYVTAVQTNNGNTSEFSNRQLLGLLFVVTNTNDSGPGSLRWVIDNTNSFPGKDNILFDIPVTDPGYSNVAGEEYWTIRPSSDLPQITESVVLDATIQPGTGNFKIRLDGQNTIATGINIGFGNSELYGLYVTGFTGTGINLFYVFGGACIIGAPGKGNLSSGNDFGFRISLANNNIIQSNIIGLDETGLSALPNRVGMSFPSNSGGNLIGGINDNERNVVSGNTSSGITINAGGAYDIINNYIGTDITGLNPIPNGNGIAIGTSSNNEIYDNVISGNNGPGLHFSLVNNSIVQGNYIGVGSDGNTAIGNDRGINFWGSTSSDNNIIGGTGPGEANIIANNTLQGVYLNTANADFNRVIGNLIYCNGGLGIDLSLAGPIGNDGKAAPEITVVTAASVSGTGIDGDVIHLYSDDSGCLPVQGKDYLGTTTVSGGVWTITGLSLTGSEIINATATDAVGSTSQFAVDYPEIDIYQGSDNTGIAVIDDQVTPLDLGTGVVGNDLDVVFTIENTSWVPLDIESINLSATEFSIIGAPLLVNPKSVENFTLRLDASNIGSFSSDVSISNNDPNESPFNFPVTGDISVDFVVTNTNDSGIGSLRFNMEAANSVAGTNTITFNIPITDPNYNASDERWTITPSTDLPTITETAILDARTQPGTAPFRVIIDGNSDPSLSRGIEMGSASCVVDGFYIKGFVDSFFSSGIIISSGDNSIVGSPTGGNVLSGNSNGVYVSGGLGHNISMNYIGTDPTGLSDEANNIGVNIESGASNLTIGGTGTPNVISGNLSGIVLDGSTGINIIDNLIGVDINGNTALPNLSGIILRSSDSNVISGNTISGNFGEGILLDNSSTNEIYGNFIGLGADGATALGNDVAIKGGDAGQVDNNVIGRTTPTYSPNIIANNLSAGIILEDVEWDFNQILGNEFYCNGGLAIDLQGLGNNNILPPSISSFTTTDVTGTGIDGELVQVYRDNSGCGPLQGQEYLGSATVSGGSWTLSGLSLNLSDYLNVTATDPSGNTSPFAYNYGELDVYEGPDILGSEILDAQVTIIDMGSSPITTDLLFPFTIRNNSGAPLLISSITSSIPEITFVSAPTSVAAFANSTFSIRLSGSTSGVYNSTITIMSNDEDESIFTFDVVGEIQAPIPVIRVYDGPDTEFEIPPGTTEPIDLGTEYYGNSVSVEISIENDGVADLIISDITVSDNTFTILDAPPFPTTLTPGSTGTIRVLLDGFTVGAFPANVIIVSNDNVNPSFVIPVIGEILPAPEIAVYEGSGIFGTEIFDGQAQVVNLGVSNIPQNISGQFTIENQGIQDLNIGSITSSNPEVVVGAFPLFIPTGTGNLATIDLTIGSTTRGVYTSTITIQSDDPDESVFIFDVSGEMVSPELHIFQGTGITGTEIMINDNLDLGTSPLNTVLVTPLTIWNNGSSDLDINLIESDNPSFYPSISSTLVTSGSQITFDLVLDGTVAGIFTATIAVSHNDPTLETFFFTVQVEILAPVVTIRENSQSGGVIDENTPIDIGTTPLSTLLEKVFVIENVGNQVLNISSISIDNSSFNILDLPSSINPGAFSEFTVVFNADVLGIQQGTVTINTDAGTFTFIVTGNVVDIVLYNAVSPNGDGVHDFLKIENIELFPSNTVYIYTRWGDTIFKVDGYNNSSNVFEGLGNQGAVEEVADGTYYYVVVYEYTNSNGESVQNTITGFFLIKRDL